MSLPPFHFARLPRGCIAVTGPDAATFLQGLITNDISLLAAQPVLYAALLTPQGKFLHDFLIYPTPGGFLLETESDPRRDDLIARLTKYRLRAKVDITPVPITVFSIFRHPRAGGDPVEIQNQTGQPYLLAPDPRHADAGWRLVITGETCAPFPMPGYHETPFDTWDYHRIALGLPDGSRDAEIGVSTLEELNIPRLHGVSFTKGCYVGQELTARMEYRGLGKRHLRIIKIADMPEGAVLRSHCRDLGLALVQDKN